VILKGLQIRGYSLEQKPFSTSFMQLWNSANPLFCLGLGLEDVDGIGQEMIRIENRNYFYDNSGITARFEDVREIKREYDHSMIFNVLDFGFEKWESESAGCIDDAQTRRVWATCLK
jgi:hypothetical protein